jgi:hypothetical protein
VPITPGTRLGQYEVQEFIGQGAMGVVYRAYHAQLARTGAVKVLLAIAPDQDSTARFRHEAQAIAQMRHPNILNVFDFGEFEGTPYMIVEYVAGGSLLSHMQHGPVDHTVALKYLRGIASGLDYAHSLGIVHRDVKPANVLLGKDDAPILADFGLAKMLLSSSVKSMTGVTTGTPAYMAPEQVTGSPIGPPADRYSLATIAYEMLTGALPFEGEGVLEMLYAHVHREPPTPSSRLPELGPGVDAVIMRGLAKDPDARWHSCEAFVAALSAALASAAAPAFEKTVMFPTGVVAAAAMPAVAPVPIATPALPTQPLRPSHRRRNVIIAAAGIVLLLVAAVVLIAAARQKPSLSLSSTTVRAGDTLVLSASHLPANQAGEFQMVSPLRIFPFRADANGHARVQISVPTDIRAGDHAVRVCWNSTCPAQATLHVTAQTASIASVSHRNAPPLIVSGDGRSL